MAGRPPHSNQSALADVDLGLSIVQSALTEPVKFLDHLLQVRAVLRPPVVLELGRIGPDPRGVGNLAIEHVDHVVDLLRHRLQLAAQVLDF